MSDDVFNTDTIAKVSQQRKEKMEAAGNFMPYFNLGEDQVGLVRFIDNEPLTFHQHRVWDPTLKEGSGAWRNLTCPRKDCPYCKLGGKNLPRYVGAYRLIHIDHTEKDDKGVEKQLPTLKVFLKGINTLEVLVRKNKRKPLSRENMEVERMGSGFSTKYLFENTGDTAEIVTYNKPDNDDLKDMFKVQRDVLDRLAKDGIKDGEKDLEKEAVKEEEASSPESTAAESKSVESTDDDYEDDIPF